MQNLKPLFLERMKKLLLDKKDFENYLKILDILPEPSIRCNTLKISVNELRERLEKKGWKIEQPWKSNPEVMIVKSPLSPGELGRALEHMLGYYYVQELASMLPVIPLNPKKGEIILDLCSSPGSKTTQMAAVMENKGTIIANEVNLGRIKILASNLERCGVTNCIITRKEGFAFCKRLLNENFKFDRILVDAPCSGEGTLRSTSRTALMWNINSVKNLSGIQKKLIASALDILKDGGELVYSTCTHAPEENEEVIDFALKNFLDVKIQKISLPLNFREGITKWGDRKYSDDLKLSARVYPHENNTEGFFITKLKKIK